VPTVRSICSDALMEIGVIAPGESMTAENGSVALTRLQQLIDSMQADRLALNIQLRTTFTLPSGTSTVTLGPTGATVTMQRPVWIDTVTYVIPGSSPAVETPIAQMGRDQYAMNSIKALQSALPTQCFYQTSNDTVVGSLFFWPQVTQDVTIALYTPQGLGVPTSLDSVLYGPPGTPDALMYLLAERLLTPFGQSPQDFPLLVGPDGFAAKALRVLHRANTMPGLLGVDPALSPTHAGGYNYLNDSTSSPNNR